MLALMVFPRLEVLDFTSNLFSGSIPPGVKQSQNLTHFLIGENQFKGALPSQMGLLGKLKQLDVSGNAAMSGTIPSQLGLATSLRILNMDGTAISPVIPQEARDLNATIVANCSQLQCC